MESCGSQVGGEVDDNHKVLPVVILESWVRFQGALLAGLLAVI
jgi:hypothetical protein